MGRKWLLIYILLVWPQMPKKAYESEREWKKEVKKWCWECETDNKNERVNKGVRKLKRKWESDVDSQSVTRRVILWRKDW
jgi:hypothetical protein